jgi:hypothetical protein
MTSEEAMKLFGQAKRHPAVALQLAVERAEAWSHGQQAGFSEARKAIEEAELEDREETNARQKFMRQAMGIA